MVARLSMRDLLLGLWLSFNTAREIFLRCEFDHVSPLLKPSHSFFQHQMKWQFLPLATELPLILQEHLMPLLPLLMAFL